MEKEFVPYELALRMKTLGFNENCYRVGNPNGAICWRFMDVAGVEGVGIDDILLEKFDKLWWVEIPTFSQAFRWFREKGYLSYIEVFNDGKYDYTNVSSYFSEEVDYNDGPFDTYEEAELTCLKKLIEIVEIKE